MIEFFLCSMALAFAFGMGWVAKAGCDGLARMLAVDELSRSIED